MNAMSAIITTQIYRKLDKIGPNTLKIVPTSTTTAEKDLEQLAISSLKITEHLTFSDKISALSPQSYNTLSYLQTEHQNTHTPRSTHWITRDRAAIHTCSELN